MLPIIDTHQHLWDLTKFNLAWVAGAEPLNRSFVMQDYLEATYKTKVVKTIYMEVDVPPRQRSNEAEYVFDLCQRDDNPMVGAVISGNVAASSFKEYLERFSDTGYLKGVRFLLHGASTPAGHCLEPAFIKGVQLLGRMGLSFDVCIRPAELADAVKLAEACPDTRLILDHCGNAHPKIVDGTVNPAAHVKTDPFWHTAQQWKDGISALAEQENVVCKISGIVARAPEDWTALDLAPTIYYCLVAFGPDRVIFGGDWPVCTLRSSFQEWASALREIIRSRPEADQRKLLSENAERLYSLSASS
jgi:L-fuconolactonase